MTTSNNKPTNGWDALIKIVEMLIGAFAGLLLFIFCTPFGWIGLIILAFNFIGHNPQPPHS